LAQFTSIWFNQVRVSVGGQESKSGPLGQLLRFPFEITALFPRGEVGFVDGLGGEDGLYFRSGLSQVVLGQLALLEALVKLLTDDQREPDDFAVRVIAVFDRCIVCMRSDDNRNASRLKSYGRFLHGLDVLLMDVRLIDEKSRAAGINGAKQGAEGNIRGDQRPASHRRQD
jgi:hypothetical protein